MVSTATLRERIDALERYDYEEYMRQIDRFSRDDIVEIFKDWRLYRCAYVWVVEGLEDGTKRPTRFHPRSWQVDYERNRTNFDVAVKSRKIGFTTDVLTEVYAKCATMDFQKVMFMSFEEDVAIETAQILQTAQEFNPWKPRLSKSNQSGMVFTDTHSTVMITTAGAKVLARGLDLTMLHMTEVAHYFKKVDDVETWLAGALDALVRGGRVVQESTPNGVDPIFFATYQAAKDGELWNPVFLSIFDDETLDWRSDHPEALASTAMDSFDLSEFEHSLLRLPKAQLGHIRFLRWEKQKLRSRSSKEPLATWIVGDERMMKQEYPTNDQSCWLQHEGGVFDADMIDKQYERSVLPLWEDTDTPNCTIRQWEKPQPGHAYVIAVDTSQGQPDSHWQGLAVLDVDRMKYVYTMRIKTGIADLTRRAMNVAVDYGHGLLMIERNNHGHAVLVLLQEYSYDNLYYHEGEKVQPGWPTSWITKPVMVTQFKDAFESGAIEVHDADVFRDMRAYQSFDPKKSGTGNTAQHYGPRHGADDDLLDAHMMAFQGRGMATIVQQGAVVHYGDYAQQGEREREWMR